MPECVMQPWPTLTLKLQKRKYTPSLMPHSNRFGLFNAAPPIAVGENNYGVKKIPERDENGKPLAGPRNFYTNKKIQGKTPDNCLFSKPTYNSIGDPFKGTAKAILEKDSTWADHENPFKPYGNEKRKVPKKYPVSWM